MYDYEPPPLEKGVYYYVNYTAIYSGTDPITGVSWTDWTSYSLGIIYLNGSVVELLDVAWILYYKNGSVIRYDVTSPEENVIAIYKNGLLIWITDSPYTYTRQFKDPNTSTVYDVVHVVISMDYYYIDDYGNIKHYNDGLHLTYMYFDPDAYEYKTITIDVAPFPDALYIVRQSGYLYATYVNATAPPKMSTKPLIELKGYTSRLLLRNPADLHQFNTVFTLRAKLYTTLNLRNITYANTTDAIQSCLYDNYGYPYFCMYVKDNFLFFTQDKDTITTPLVFVYDDVVFFVNNFELDQNTKKYVFHSYRAYKILNTPTCYTEVSTDRTICTNLMLIRDDTITPPFYHFNALFASYEYSIAKGWVLTLIFSTDMGTFTFYTPLNDIIFYGIRVLNITDPDSYDHLETGPQILNAYISMASFYYWVLTDTPELFIFSREKAIELKVPANLTQFTININPITYLSCQDLVRYYGVRDPTMIPACWNMTYARVVEPVKATLDKNITVNIETYEIKVKRYSPPDFWNVPAWMSFIFEVFTDVASFIATSIQAIGSLFLSTLLNKDMWTMFFIFIVFAHVIVILHNPADLYSIYRELFDITHKVFKTVYDVMIHIAEAVASIIEAINPL
jgi:hypothetical protein